MRKSKYTKELLDPIVKDSFSISEILEKLNLKNTGGNYQHIQGHIKRHMLDTNHFTGQGWSKGKTFNTDSRIKRKGYTDDQVFVKHGVLVKSDNLRIRMLRNAFIYKCQRCNNSGEWFNEKLQLHIDHIDGDHHNNEKSNLRFLCPNCHQLTSTWGNKK